MCVEQVGQVVAVADADNGVVIVAAGDSYRRIWIALLLFEGVEVAPGDWLLTHTGLAVRVLPEDEAAELVKVHEEMRSAATRGC